MDNIFEPYCLADSADYRSFMSSIYNLGILTAMIQDTVN